MRALLLSDLVLALPHLLDEKSDDLSRTLCGQRFLPRLAAQLRALETLPSSSPVVGRPLAEALAETELCHATIELLSELRTAIAEELIGDPAALDRAEVQIFGFIDQLSADREAAVRRRARATTMVTPGSVVAVDDRRPAIAAE